MKTKQLFFTGLFLVSAFFTNAQNNVSTSAVTSGGLFAGTLGIGNAFYGYHAGRGMTDPDINGKTIGNNNTCIGQDSGMMNIASNATFRMNNNVFVGYNTGYKSNANLSASGSVFIGANVGLSGSDVSNKLAIDNSTTNTPLIWGDFATDRLKFNGKVGVGFGFGNFPAMAGNVNVSSYNLFVNGGILTEQVRVILENNWADYVFEEEYNLLKLEEVEVFIKENKHLPNMPSAKEVGENGIELGEITTIQQEKIEELTLYVIEQNKLNKEQTEQLKKQQSEIGELKEQVKLLLENQNNPK